MELKTILQLMATYDLSADELLLIYLTFLARNEEGHSEFFAQWYNNGGKKQLGKIFNSLKDKQIIHKDYNPTSYVPNEIEFNKNFLKSWPKNSLEMGRELFEAYPPFININGKYAPLRDISKRFSSLDEFFFFYSSEIGHNPEKHKEVMEILEWAKENGHLNFGILSFVISHQWDSLKMLKDNPDIAPISQNSIYIDE